MLKTVDPKEVVEFIPSKEKDDKQPTTVYFRRISKREYDKYLNSLTEMKRNKIVSKADKASEVLFDLCLTPNSEGILVKNIMIEGTAHKEVKDKEVAVKALLGLEDIESANEIESAMRGQSSLDEDEEKNSDGQ